MKKMAVYCGASVGNKAIYQEQTKKLGQWMHDNEYDLVYGGGNVGLMGSLADTVIENGGKAIGVMPTFLLERELAHQNITEMHIVNDMHERKRKMIDLADCYLALPGGPGTLEEISEVVSWGRVGEHQNPCIFFNVDGYYDLLAEFFDKMVADGFLTKEDRDKIFFSDDLAEIQQFIEAFTPPAIRQYK
ncbi:decarboxylase [Enterococcus haemoperoxidus ATCC BAA-382]|uniref:Cytokinin riboside 5'-monophosphate phosphoribohydrolase n=1 Tax=Enterococcus haemoperoxidus ATCC BAA-382 TaxID=1158608 RepID=R2QP02_9ENTE|nr:TIGR00730 family Rossman fold protein [Enterococcus haemoperoxidus]EOH98267.1 decarboxylase [Enterococcus haemoperoxidus ATCC BAA-382]EOT59780.1 decarboxylase [Enterococcus haemoperoxidus ATCC BAA-382]OJG55961.1 decarboxylase [Enterococcus haemoperoxidus]